MATEAASTASDMGGAAGDGAGIFEECVGAVKNGVTGGTFFVASYWATFLGVIIFFLVSLVNASSTWGDPVTTITFTREDKLEYPDFYLCLNAEYLYTYLPNTINPDGITATMHAGLDKGSGYPTPILGGDIENGGCDKEHWSVGLMKMSPEGIPTPDNNGDIPEDKEGKIVDKIHPCPYEAPIMGGNGFPDKPLFEPGITFGSSGWDRPEKPTQHSEWATKLAESMPNLEIPKETAKQLGFDTVNSVCVAYPSKGGVYQYASEGSRYFPMLQFQSNGIDAQNPFWAIYVSAPGVPPVDEFGNVTAMMGRYPGMGSASFVYLQPERFKDERDGQTNWTTTYTYKSWFKSVIREASTGVHAECDSTALLMETSCWNPHAMFSVMGLGFDNFIVREVTVRSKTFGEISAEIGGLWTIAMTIMGFLWVKSGHINGQGGRETSIFRFLPAQTRKQMLIASAAAKGGKVVPA